MVIKVYGFLVYSYSCHKLGDLSTTLEMTELSQFFLQERTPICGEVCVASEVFLRKVKFVYDKWSFTKGEVAVIKEYRHFDQVKRVEKSPKAKQYCTTILLSPCLLQSIFYLLTLTYPYFPKALSNSAIHTSVFSSTHTTPYLFLSTPCF